ncbi:MAG: uroporphyrinogen-III C-methyltransferase [Saprospiraceae bacterium]|nr:uroporphyrinogen-III C-methyltransferase [Saprospiraceae bacterium]
MKKLTIIGAGPGDPELLTIKGLKALQSADVVLYDALVNPVLLDHAPNATYVFVGKRRGYKSYKQQEINELIVEFAKTNEHIVRLKGGDPFVFGRGFEEMEFAQSYGIDTEYIPGISSSIGVPGLANIPVTHRNLSRSFWVVTATASDGSLSPDIHLAAQSDATVVVLMGLSKLSEIAEIFQKNGKSALPVAVLQDGSLPTAKNVFGTVENIVEVVEKERIRSPAVIVLGEVVGLQNVTANFSRQQELENLLTQAAI